MFMVYLLGKKKNQLNEKRTNTFNKNKSFNHVTEKNNEILNSKLKNILHGEELGTKKKNKMDTKIKLSCLLDSEMPLPWQEFDK